MVKRPDGLKWLVILLLLIAGVVANSYFSTTAGAIRAAVGIVWVIALVGIVFTTEQGQRAWEFIKSARSELRKVVWPTRQETVQTTFIVVGVVIVAALLLWGMDTLFMWVISFLTGQRG